MAKKVENFEHQLKRLEEIVKQLESGQLPLEDSLKIFEEGVHLSRTCHERLGDAERRVELLLQDASGGLKTEPYPEHADDDLDPVE